MDLFRGRAQCSTCHQIAGERPALTDGLYHAVHLKALRELNPAKVVTQVASLPPIERMRLAGTRDDVAVLGRFNVTLDPRDLGAYRTPSLRNVAITAPYMHDGSVATLRDAVELELYYRNARAERPLLLTPSEKAQLVAFLNALTNESNDGSIAESPQD